MSKKNKQGKQAEQEAEVTPIEQPVDRIVEHPASVPEVKAEEAKVQFDGWYALRSGVIPAVHKKEILKADFMGRKVPMVATVAEFDEALKKYGVKLA